MYIRTEQNETVNSWDYDSPYVIPYEETTWNLCMDKKGEDTITIIGTFETVGKANYALSSLKEAIEKDEGWDIIFHKENNPMTAVGL